VYGALKNPQRAPLFACCWLTGLRQVIFYWLYNELNKPHLFGPTQSCFYFNSANCPDMYATCSTNTHQYWCYQTTNTPWRWERSSRNVGKPSRPDAAACRRKFHWNMVCLMRYHNGMASIQIDSALFWILFLNVTWIIQLIVYGSITALANTTDLIYVISPPIPVPCWNWQSKMQDLCALRIVVISTCFTCPSPA